MVRAAGAWMPTERGRRERCRRREKNRRHSVGVRKHTVCLRTPLAVFAARTQKQIWNRSPVCFHARRQKRTHGNDLFPPKRRLTKVLGKFVSAPYRTPPQKRTASSTRRLPTSQSDVPNPGVDRLSSTTW